MWAAQNTVEDRQINVTAQNKVTDVELLIYPSNLSWERYMIIGDNLFLYFVNIRSILFKLHINYG